MLALRLKKGPGIRETEEREGAARTALGEKPGAVAVKEAHFVADVINVNKKTGVVTIKGAKGRIVDLKIKDKAVADTHSDFSHVQPTGVFRGVVKDDATQKHTPEARPTVCYAIAMRHGIGFAVPPAPIFAQRARPACCNGSLRQASMRPTLPLWWRLLAIRATSTMAAPASSTAAGRRPWAMAIR